MSLTFQTKKVVHTIIVDPAKGAWLLALLPKLGVAQPKQLTLAQVKADYEAAGLEDFELFWDNKPVSGLYKVGLLRV